MSHDTSVIWSIFWGLGAGAWGLGRWEKVEKCFIFGTFFLTFQKHNEKMMKSLKFARIGLILMQNDSPHRVLDSWGGFDQFFQKIGKKIKFEFSEKSRFSGFFRGNPRNQPPSPILLRKNPSMTPQHPDRRCDNVAPGPATPV